MKTKKLLSLLLAIIMVVSIMVTFTVTSSGAISVNYVGDTMTFRITGQLSDDEEEGCVKNIAFTTGTNSQTGESYVDGEILSTEQVEGIIKVTVKATKAGDVSISYQIYTGESWENKQTKTTSVYPTILVGETITCTIPNRTLYPDNPDGNIKNITAENATVVSTVQNDEDVDVTLKATSVGTIYVIFDEKEEGALDFSSNERLLAKAIPESTYLDLDNTTTDIKDSKTIDQNYNLTVDENYTDVTKVKLSWEIKDINVTRTDNKSWDTENLCWKTDSSSTTINQQGTAKFTLENYSSIMIDAKVTFDTVEYATEKKFTAPTLVFDEDNDENTEDDGVITLDTAALDNTYSKTNVPNGEINVTVTPDTDDFKTLVATTKAAKYGIYTVTISEYEEPACIASGAMVTLADGTKKVIDDITVNDQLLTYNFFSGKIEANKPIYILKNDNILSSVITLYFSDGSELEMCDEQSFFDMEARDYILISRKNYQDAIGKKIMQIKDGKIETVTITDITLNKRYCTSYELTTENAVNFVTNDIVNTPPEYFLPGTYTVGEDMKIDAEQYNEDVAKYGLYTYADFEKYISENTFVTGHIADVKIAVGKGLISEEDVFSCYEEWVPVIHDTNK